MLVHSQTRLAPEGGVIGVLEIELHRGVFVLRYAGQRCLASLPRDAGRPLQKASAPQHLADGLPSIRVLGSLLARDRHAQNPPQQAQMQRATAAQTVVVSVGRAVKRDHRHQAGRMLRGRMELGPGHVGRPMHADLAVAQRMLGQPDNRVVPVFGIVEERKERPFRGESAAAILRRREVPVLGKETHQFRPPGCLVVRRPQQHRRKPRFCRPAVFRRDIQVRGQLHAIAHRDHHVLEHHDIPGPVTGPRRSLGLQRPRRRPAQPQCERPKNAVLHWSRPPG